MDTLYIVPGHLDSSGGRSSYDITWTHSRSYVWTHIGCSETRIANLPALSVVKLIELLSGVGLVRPNPEVKVANIVTEFFKAT